MTSVYRRSRPKKADSLAAAAISFVAGAGVAAVTFYFARLFLSRESVSPSQGDERLLKLSEGGRKTIEEESGSAVAH